MIGLCIRKASQEDHAAYLPRIDPYAVPIIKVNLQNRVSHECINILYSCTFYLLRSRYI